MANAEYKFTNKNADVRGRVAEVVEFAKSRGILLKQIEVFKAPKVLKDADTTHEVFDTLGGCEPSAPKVKSEPAVPEDEEVYESLCELFAKVFSFDE